MTTFKTTYNILVGDVVYKDSNLYGRTYHVVHYGKFYYVLNLSMFDLTQTHKKMLKTKSINIAIDMVKQHCPTYE